MAEGLLRHMAGDRFDVMSAGVAPTRVRPEAIEAMREIGVDISQQRSKSVDEFAGREFDYVITVCDNANEQCPVFPGRTERIHWSFDDPAELSAFRRVRDEIHQRLKEFCVDGSVMNDTVNEWRENARYWVKHSGTIRTMFEPVTRVLIDKAGIREGHVSARRRRWRR